MAISINFPINLLPVHEQKQIGTQLDALAAATQRMEVLHAQKLAALAALEKIPAAPSVFQRAVKGTCQQEP